MLSNSGHLPLQLMPCIRLYIVRLAEYIFRVNRNFVQRTCISIHPQSQAHGVNYSGTILEFHKGFDATIIDQCSDAHLITGPSIIGTENFVITGLSLISFDKGGSL